MANTQQFVQALNGLTATRALWHADLVADLAALRASVVAITAKLDAENVTNLDTNYGAVCNPAALRTRV